jgi:hypothetical protein
LQPLVAHNIPNGTKGEAMKKNCIRVLTAFWGLASFAVVVRGQAADQLVVKIPYEFVVAGKTLPAGTYRINRAGDFDQRVLVISSFENRTSVLVRSTDVEEASSNQPALSFQRVGEQYVLSKIGTPEHVYAIPVSSSDALQAAMKGKNAPSMSGTSGSN